jgi:hypothetical protein
LSNLSDWTPEEQALLYGAKNPVFDPSKVLDMDDTATVEALITGQAAYEEVFGDGASAGPTTTVTVVEGPGVASDSDADAAKEAALDAASTLIGHEETATDATTATGMADASSASSSNGDLLFAAEPPAVELISGDARAPEILESEPEPSLPLPTETEPLLPEPVVLTDESGVEEEAPAVPLGVLVEKPSEAEADAALLASAADSGLATIPPADDESAKEPVAGEEAGGAPLSSQDAGAVEALPPPSDAPSGAADTGKEPVGVRRRILGRALPAASTTMGGGGGGLVLPAVIDYRFADANPYKLTAVTPVKVS